MKKNIPSQEERNIWKNEEYFSLSSLDRHLPVFVRSKKFWLGFFMGVLISTIDFFLIILTTEGMLEALLK